MKLKRNFFLKPTIQVAKNLLGKVLVRSYKGKIIAGEIIETEAYKGPFDMAAHSKNWRITPRNFVEYSQGGFVYIYLVYGMYWQLNFTTYLSGTPECVLIRAIKPLKGIDLMKKFRKTNNINQLANGPGKLCQAFGINGSFYGKDLTKNKDLWLETNSKSKPFKIKSLPRIGIDYAGSYWSSKKWRFLKI